MSYVIIAIVNEMMYRSLHLAYWQWWRGGSPQIPGGACCMTSQAALTLQWAQRQAVRSRFWLLLLNDGVFLPEASETSFSKLFFPLEWSVGSGRAKVEWAVQCWSLPCFEQLQGCAGFQLQNPRHNEQDTRILNAYYFCLLFEILQSLKCFHGPDGFGRHKPLYHGRTLNQRS